VGVTFWPGWYDKTKKMISQRQKKAVTSAMGKKAVVFFPVRLFYGVSERFFLGGEDHVTCRHMTVLARDGSRHLCHGKKAVVFFPVRLFFTCGVSPRDFFSYHPGQKVTRVPAGGAWPSRRQKPSPPPQEKSRSLFSCAAFFYVWCLSERLFFIPPRPVDDPRTCRWGVAVPETKAVTSAMGKKP